MGTKKTINEFISESNNIHNSFYNYDDVIYINNSTKVSIICPIHGVFEQTPNNHLSGQKCRKCKIEERKNTTNGILERFMKIHKDQYNYDLVKYNNMNEKVEIVCPEHGVFKQTPNNHLKGQGCLKCKNENQKLTLDKFIEKSNIIHTNKYNYENVNYIKNNVKVIIECPFHGDFYQRPDRHLSGQGCPICKESKGEKEIANLLDKHNIKYIREKRFNLCKNILKLPFDFYLPDYNMCIEYDGIQHFESIEFFGGDTSLEKTKNRDNIKDIFCFNEGINLIRFKFDEKINEKFYELFYSLL